MKQALVIKRDGKKLVTSMNFHRCLFEFVNRGEIQMEKATVGDNVDLPDLQKVVSFLNGEYEPEEPQEVEIIPLEQQEFPDFSTIQDANKGALVREMVKRRLRDNQYETAGCGPFEIKLSAVYDHWNTGLSRGGLSKLLSRAAKELEEQEGLRIYGAAGRYRNISATAEASN